MTDELKVLETTLAYSHTNFSFLLPSAVKSENTTNLLSNTIYTSNNIQYKLNKINGLEADAVKQEFHSCFSKNQGFKAIYEISYVMGGGTDSED
jgi:hypothetical protein